MSPYIVTTKRVHVWVDMPTGENDSGERSATTTQRRAVATLEEARDVGWGISCKHLGGDPAPFVALSESGGTVGPLPDGTLVEVEPCGYFGRLYDESGLTAPATPAEVLVAFNARQSA